MVPRDEGFSETELVRAARWGDKRAFGVLVERYTPLVQSVIRRMIQDALFHHDLLQESLLQAYLSLDTLAQDSRFRSWLYGITRHTCLMHLRVQRIRSISLEFLAGSGGEVPSERPTPEEITERLELRRLLWAAVDQLSPANREAVVLFYYEDFDLRETAHTLGVSVNTVKGRLHRARQHLHHLLSVSEFTTEREEIMIPVKLVDVVLRTVEQIDEEPRSHYQLVLLDEAGRRALVIWVGEYEGLQIAYKLNGQTFPRPLTQAFFARLIEAGGASLERVEVSALKNDVFYATTYLKVDGEIRQVDARPSDALGLAVHTGTPIFVSEQVMDAQGFAIPENHAPTGKGAVEIQVMLEAMQKADAERVERIRSKPEYQQLHDHQQEGQLVVAKVFAEIKN